MNLRVLIVANPESDCAPMIYEMRKAGFNLLYERVDRPGAMEQALIRNSWDLVLARYHLHHFPQGAALALLCKCDPDLPLIFVSETAGEEAAISAIRSGASGFIPKGGLARLVPAIHRELNSARRRNGAPIDCQAGSGKETILLADDHDGVRAFAQEGLQQLGYTVMPACDGEEAVSIFRQHSPSISVVILDVTMPKMSGPEAHQAISGLRPGVPSIFITGYSREYSLLSELIAQGAAIVQKPFTHVALGKQIRQVLDS
jgi:DNA-binding NtrC family response regulator